jgi:phosphoribosylaminoimidazole carboxylase PurE protein
MKIKKTQYIAVVLASKSDLEIMQDCADTLKSFKVDFSLKILSAHRTPSQTIAFAKTARKAGYKVIIAAAGGAAHLAGIIAAHTTLPVIGVPMHTKALAGIDSLFSTVQMPAGVPVATMAIGKAGAANAAIFALGILALGNSTINKKLIAHKKTLARGTLKK